MEEQNIFKDAKFKDVFISRNGTEYVFWFKTDKYAFLITEESHFPQSYHLNGMFHNNDGTETLVDIIKKL